MEQEKIIKRVKQGKVVTLEQAEAIGYRLVPGMHCNLKDDVPDRWYWHGPGKAMQTLSGRGHASKADALRFLSDKLKEKAEHGKR